MQPDQSTPRPEHYRRDSRSGGRLPRWVTGLVWVISLLPILLVLLGVDFSSHPQPLPLDELSSLSPGARADALFNSLSGAFLHVILEWTSVAAAVIVCILCLSTWRFQKSATLPAIGVALLCAGTMDTFHTLAATRLVEASADNAQLIPFSWAIARVFAVVITTAGVLVATRYRGRSWAVQKRSIQFICLGFIGLSYILLHIIATSPDLPQVAYPDSFITRPWDAGPLVLWLLAWVFVFRPFHKQDSSVFSHALLISIVPELATEAHMAFGSSALFDAHFNIAHMLKVVTYVVPGVGLLLEYNRALAAERDNVLALKIAEEGLKSEQLALAEANRDLLLRNEELDEFAHIASHDLQEPLRKLVSFSDLLRMDAGDGLNQDAENDLTYITDAANRMSVLVQDILKLSRTGRNATNLSEVPIAEVIQDVLAGLDLTESGANSDVSIRVAPMPKVVTDRVVLRQVFQNLLSNAIKYRTDVAPRIRITTEHDGSTFLFSISDNGIGIDKQYRETIFAPFKRLHGRNEYAGTGIGLAICKKSINSLGGEIWVEEAEEQGSTFSFTLPHLSVPKAAQR